MKSDDSAQQRKSKKMFDSFEKIKILTQLFFSEQKKAVVPIKCPVES